ncbi:MAG TPA: hypothetical protein VFH27_00645 [Longimicrobiaceae bacterium]|nr:hypothetical protein [Longimicrobiaceae bacterium]
MTDREGDEAPFRAPLEGAGGASLRAERRRDGGVSLSVEGAPGGEMVLSGPDAAALAGWLTPTVQREWMDTVREHLAAQLATADALYGDEKDGTRRFAMALLDEVPPALLSRALVLLANDVGPRGRERLVGRINATGDFSEDLQLRRRLADEGDAFAYVVAAAALLDALDPDAPEFGGPEG